LCVVPMPPYLIPFRYLVEKFPLTEDQKDELLQILDVLAQRFVDVKWDIASKAIGWGSTTKFDSESATPALDSALRITNKFPKAAGITTAGEAAE